MTESARLLLSAAIAREFYVERRSKIDIAHDFQLSRFAVARLLDFAHEQGIVEITVNDVAGLDLTRSIQLRETFGLRHTAVTWGDEDSTVELAGIGRAAADLIGDILAPTDVLGLTWARSVQAMIAHLRALPAVPVVQLTGALSLPTENGTAAFGDSSVDMVRDVARIAGGPAYRFFSPFLVADARTARALRQQPEVQRVFDQMRNVSLAVAGVGHWAPGQSTLFDAATPREREQLRRQGVIAEIAGVCITADGEVVHTPLNDRMMSVTGDQLRAIDQLVVMPYGTAKLPAVRAALRSGLVGSIVTHTALARALLDEATK